MATLQPQQPLVCASLHLPPDSQTFLRIHEIALYKNLPNIEDLRLGLEASQSMDTEALGNLYESLTPLTTELHNVFQVVFFAQEVAKRYRQVLEALEEKRPTQVALFEFYLGAGGGVLHAKGGREALSVFRREFENAVERPSTTTGTEDKRSSSPSLTSDKNVQSVSEVFTAINECHGLLQKCQGQFLELRNQTENKDSIDSNPPSEEETQVMRAKWQTFFNNVNGVWRQCFEIATEISMPTSDGPPKYIHVPESREPKQSVPFWRSLFQPQDKRDLVRSRNLQETPMRAGSSNAAVSTPGSSHEIRANIEPTDPIERLGRSEHTTVPDTISPDRPMPGDSRVPIWRRIFQRSSSVVSGRLEVDDNAPAHYTTAPPLKIPFWRKLFRHLTCVSTEHRG